MVVFGRLLTAMVTPFDGNGAVDYTQARRLAKALVASGTEGLVVTGTTGENPALAPDENYRLWSEVKEAVGGSAHVIAGSGTNGTAETVHLSKEAERAGADGLLIVVPYYNKPTQEGIFRHVEAIAASTALPVVPYNVPSRTIVNMTAETCLRIAELPNVCGVKEASGDMAQIGEIIDHAPDGFHVWSGNDADTFHVVSMGGYGVVSVSAHLIGLQIQRMIHDILEGDLRAAAAEHRRQLPISKDLFIVANPIPVKYCLNKAGFNVGLPRLPLIEPDAQTAAQLDAMLAKYTVDLPLGIAA
jgi:4-hydroxy-tetrahydrodipicolinate synthase